MEPARSILVVDDDAVFGSVLVKAFARRGLIATAVPRASDALAALRERQTDYALVDLRIGEDSGLRLVEQIRALRPETAIVVLTGFASIATAVEAIKLGARHYLAKPADADQILAAFGREEGDAGSALTHRPPSVRKLEWEHLQRVLREHNGNISATARALGMHRRTLQRKLGKRPVRS